MSKSIFTVEQQSEKEYAIVEECSNQEVGIVYDEDNAKLLAAAPAMFDKLHEALLLLQEKEVSENMLKLFIDNAYDLLQTVEED